MGGDGGAGAGASAAPATFARSWHADLLQRAAFALVFRPFLTLFVGLRVIGREHLPARDPFVLIANHSSHLDAVSLLSLFPLGRLQRVRPVAAADYFERNPLMGWATRTFFHTLPIARREVSEANDPRPRMLAALRAGQSLVLFPEGTRGKGGELGRFRTGVAWLVEQAPEVPVVPAYLVNMGRSLPKGEFLPVPFFCEIRLGAPIHPRGSTEQVLAELEQAVRGLAPSPAGGT